MISKINQHIYELDKDLSIDYIYLSPSVINILNINFQKNDEILFRDFYSIIPLNKIKYKYDKHNPITLNLNIVKKIKIMKMKNYNHEIDNFLLKKFTSISENGKEKIISINQLITIPDQEFQISSGENSILDLFYGSYKNNFYYYKIVEIEYEEYDSINLICKIKMSLTLTIALKIIIIIF